MFDKCLKNVKEKKPLVHNITNYVTVNDVANIILAIGASPIMADEPLEAFDIQSICSCLNINMGTLNEKTIEAMLLSGKRANELNHPIIFDPVGFGASRLRVETAEKILNEIKVDVIKGNISEIKALFNKSKTTRGVDADEFDKITDENIKSAKDLINKLAKKYNTVIAVTGEIDIVSNGDICFAIKNGCKEMESISGTGCQLSGLIASFIGANPDNILNSVVTAVCIMGLSGEIAKSHLKEYEGNSTYRNLIIDSVNNITLESLKEGAKYEII